MLSIDYYQTDYFTLLHFFGNRLQARVENDFFIFPSHIGSGHCKYLCLPNGLQCLIADFTLLQDMYLYQKRSEEEFYTLRLNECNVVDKLMVKIDNDYIWEERQKKAHVLLTSSLFDFAYLASKGNSVRSINILIPKQWLVKYMADSDTDESLKKYLTLKTSSYNFAPFDACYQSLFDQAMNRLMNNKAGNDAAGEVMIMFQKFFGELAGKLNILREKDKIRISADEVRRLREVESFLIKDFSGVPPSISQLSKVAAMSTTSLKNKFKKMYGNTLYEYFQKSRMQKAKVLILTRKYSIKEIGGQLGYANSSNFTIAFKKEFNRLPSQFLISLLGLYGTISMLCR